MHITGGNYSMAANTIKAIYVQTAKPAAEFAADTTTVWAKNLLLIEEDTLKMKMGDGVNTYGNLKYANLSYACTHTTSLVRDEYIHL